MIEQISTIISMDGNGLYVWSCLFILFFIIGINIYLPNRKLNRIYKENKTKAQ
jgi:hypothetical protein|tara:strand:- start:1819 stop:1977 length:159 start_codon:yes stop_codon:yes gene_type:complete